MYLLTNKSSGKIVAVCTSQRKGTGKIPVDSVILKVDFGVVGDAHAGGGDPVREISLLAIESIERMNSDGYDFRPGDFAENLTTMGIELASLPVGTGLKIGEEVVLKVTQIGKKCHIGCAVFKLAGRCIMPKEGVFARVVEAGTIRPNDSILILPKQD